MSATLSQKRKEAIIDSLVKHGVEPTEQAVQDVFSYQQKHQVSVSVACESLAKEQGQTHQQTAQTGINAALQGQIGMAQKMGQKMGNRMTKISARYATHQFMSNLADGTYANEMDAEFALIEAAIDGELSTLESNILGAGNAPLLLESSVEAA